jgi:hypothetical protein
VSVWTWISLGLLIASLAYLLHGMIVGIRREHERGQALTREFGLSLALLALFLNAWAAQTLAEWQQFAAEQAQHGQSVSWAEFLPRFLTSTMSNHQSEYLQLWAFVTLTARHIHKGSAESRDSDEQTQAALGAVDAKLGETAAEIRDLRSRVNVMLDHFGL